MITNKFSSILNIKNTRKINRSTAIAAATSVIAIPSQKIQGVDNLGPFFEHYKYNIALYKTTIFPYEHTHRVSTMERRVLSFRFRPIEFNKKRSLLFFLALELITSKKAVAVLSSQNIQS